MRSHARRTTLKNYIQFHLQALKTSLRRMLQTPYASFITIGVISIALALPALFFLLLENASILSRGLDDSSQITLYLKKEVDQSHAQNLMAQLKMQPDIKAVKYISPTEGLQDFADQSGFTHILDALPYNPIPGVVVVTPALTTHSPELLNHLAANLRLFPEVEQAELDVQWVQRLYAMINMAKVFVGSLGILLGVAVVLIVGNTIHLSMRDCLEEIKIIKMFGATHAFIRRPFLYTGLCFGFLSALLAVVIIEIFLNILETPLAKLMQLYQSVFHLHHFTFVNILYLCFCGILLGLTGAFVSIAASMKKI